MNQRELFSNIDMLIKAGKAAAAVKSLKKIRAQKLSASDRETYASLARRLSLPELSIRLLHPFVRPPVASLQRASLGEKAEYAAALIYVGAFAEALEILEGVPCQKYPSQLLFRAFAYIGQWNYAEAIPLLQDYSERTDLSHYQRMVGKTNLCEALIYERHPLASETIEETIKEAREHSYTIILGRLQTILIDLMLATGNLGEAERLVKESEKAFQNADTRDAFFVRKWRALISLHREGGSKAAIAQLDAVRKEATERWLHWETVRDCDYYQAMHTRDYQLALSLFCGTPFDSFRKRLLSSFKTLTDSVAVEWRIGNGSQYKTLELLSGESPLRRRLLDSGKLNYLLLSFLTRDFYRPARISAIAAALYPGEFYNPQSSPKRVRTAIQRLREWFRAHKLPLTIEEVSGDYRLQSKKAVGLLVPLERETDKSKHPELELLREVLSAKPFFSRKDVVDALSTSVRTANRLLKEGEETGVLRRQGKGRSTVYFWADEHAPKLVA